MFTAPAPVQPFGVGSIFGAKATSNTGMFGTTQPATSNTGMFGTTQPATSNSGMFGTTQPATSNFGIPAQPATSGLFGALATPGSSMFGNAVGGGQGNLFGKRNNE